METILLEILSELRRAAGAGAHLGGLPGAQPGGCLDDDALAKIIRRHNRNRDGNNVRHYSKKRLLPWYLGVKQTDPERWAAWGIDEATEEQLLRTLRMKPGRTASGVATITVITKPWGCASDCLYCPSDVRMPKSYLSDEPACQRAERNYFDPYLQVASRLRALTHMGHATDKVELIVLGGTWSDYPAGYQTWFVRELFRALNDAGLQDGDGGEHNARARRRFYREQGCVNRPEELARLVAGVQGEVDGGALTYNQAIERLYADGSVWQDIAREQTAALGELEEQQCINETAQHRVVGLVIETRPDAISAQRLTLLRRLGCTKIQMGIQSLDPSLLRLNRRYGASPHHIRSSFELLRVFGFKIHVHFMMNLYGATPEGDKRDYLRLVTEAAYLPDEVKLYPCSLVRGTRLCGHYEDGSWQPYGEDVLLDILETDVLNTPAFVRISRMIRDISAHDIVAGNKKANLRQLVERRIAAGGGRIAEIRHREIRTDEADIEGLTLELLSYETTATSEHFLQWVTPTSRIAGFLRLSLPREDYVSQHQALLPIAPREAMIREVHIYGRVARLHRGAEGERGQGQGLGRESERGEGTPASGDAPRASAYSEVSDASGGEGAPDEGAQHLGLGKRLIEAACDIARTHGYERLNVISSVGTREYYRALGFRDKALYQQLDLG